MAIALNTVKAPTGGTVSSAPTLPLASEPAPANKALVNKPTVQPLGAAPAAPTLPMSPAPASGPTTQPADRPTATQGGEKTTPAPAAPPAPSPYQTNDPLAFMPAPAGSTVTETAQNLAPSGTMPAPAPPVTEGSGFLPPDVSSAIGTQAPQTTSNGGVTLTPTTPDSSLTNYTISPGELADRFGIAKDKISDWNALEEPIFNRTIQNISQNRAGAGQLGSGMVRGAFADAANTYDTQRLAAERGFLNDALGGSIDDAFKSVGVAQQEQQFQAGQQNTAFNQNMSLQQLQDSEQGQQWQELMSSMGFNADQMQRAFDNAYKAQQLSDDETGQAFNRALQQAVFGAQGDPAQFLEWLSGQYALPQGYTGATTK